MYIWYTAPSAKINYLDFTMSGISPTQRLDEPFIKTLIIRPYLWCPLRPHQITLYSLRWDTQYDLGWHFNMYYLMVTQKCLRVWEPAMYFSKICIQALYCCVMQNVIWIQNIFRLCKEMEKYFPFLLYKCHGIWKFNG